MTDAFTHASPTYQNAQRGCVRDRRIPIISGDDLGPLPDPRAANDNSTENEETATVGDHENEGANAGVFLVLLALCTVGMAAICALQARGA